MSGLTPIHGSIGFGNITEPAPLTSHSTASSQAPAVTPTRSSSNVIIAPSTQTTTRDTSANGTDESFDGARVLGVVRRREDESKSGSEDISREKLARLDTTYGALLLMKQYKALSRDPPAGISVGLIGEDLYKWNVILEGPEGTIFEGGYFPCTLIFPYDYPNNPPQMTFKTTGFWHPNVFRDGRVCISILHSPDESSGNEPLSEKWRPVLGVEQVLVSVLSMLNEPNCNSPANGEASAQYRDNYDLYKERVRAVVRRSTEEL